MRDSRRIGCIALWTILGLVDAVALMAAAGSGPTLSFEHLTVEDGLSHGSVHDILQDDRGFIWFGTEDGLNRYDGYRITVFNHDPSNPNSLASSNFGKMHQDADGYLWLGTWGGGLDRFDPVHGQFIHYRHDPEDPRSLSDDRIEMIFEDRFGNLWIGTETAGLNRFEASGGQRKGYFTHFRHRSGDPTSLSSDSTKAICEDEMGRLWIGTDNGLDLFDPQLQTFTHPLAGTPKGQALSSPRIRALAADGAGSLWIGTRGGGLNRLDLASGQVRHYVHDPHSPGGLGDDSVARLFFDSQGTLWIGTYLGGLQRFDPTTETFSQFRYDAGDPNSLSHDRVESFWEDRSSILWIGTRGGGVNKLDLEAKKFTNYVHDPGRADGLPKPTVRAIAEAPGEAGRRLWIGTDGGGLALLDRATGHFHHLRHRPADATSLSTDRVLSILAESPELLWVGTYDGGLNRLVGRGDSYQATSFQHDPADPTSLSSSRVQTILEDRQGHLWLGTADGLNRLIREDGGDISFERFYHDPEEANSLSHSYIIVLQEDRDGMLWIGTRGGLTALDAERGVFRRFHHRPADAGSLSSDIVHAIHEDRDLNAILWIGTEDGGLNRLDRQSGRVTYYSVDDGLPSNVIDAIQQDDSGSLWLSTSRGLTRFDPRLETFRNFDQSDGLVNHSFLRNASWGSSDGEMFFGSLAGLVSFRPDEIHDNTHVPPVVVTDFKVFDSPIELERAVYAVDDIELDYKDNFISIEFAALDYTSSTKNRYSYQLQGVDATWSEPTGRTYANYTKLDPGHYVFKIRGSNNDGVWNETGAAFNLHIVPPFWLTWWFRVAVLAMVLAAVWSIYAFRVRAIRRRSMGLEIINQRLNGEITERRQAEADLAEKNEELAQSNAELERFTYTVSHDLKAPLVTIKGFLGILGQDLQAGKTEHVRDDMARIASAADTMSNLLDELLELSRVGRVVNTPEAIPLTQVVRQALALVAGAVEERGVVVDIDPDMPVVWGDRTRMLEVFQNLIDNAVKFMGRQSEPRIVITASSKHEVQCTVSDNGIGILPEYQEKIFGLFNQLHPNGQGSGVGLTLVRRIIEVHGGQIHIESSGVEGEGARFVLTLPKYEEGHPP